MEQLKGISNQDSNASMNVVADTTSTPVSSTAPGTDPATGDTSNPPDYKAIAAKLNDAIDQFEAMIPDLQRKQADKAKALVASRSLSTDFILQAINTVQAVPELQALNRLDTAGANDAVVYINAFRQVALRLANAQQDLIYTIDVMKAKYGAGALQVFDLTQGLARDPEHADLTKYVDVMRKALGRTGRKKKTTPTPPATTPAAPVAAPPVIPEPVPVVASPAVVVNAAASR